MGKDKLVNVERYPLHMQKDYYRHNQNVRAGNILCKKCSGTGNQLYSMYQKCTDCSGTGIRAYGIKEGGDGEA